MLVKQRELVYERLCIDPLTPELNPSAQRYVARFFTDDFSY
jgi:hypothetical protein